MKSSSFLILFLGFKFKKATLYKGNKTINSAFIENTKTVFILNYMIVK